MNQSPNELERMVLDKLLSGNDPVLIELRKQLSLAHVVSREMTGAGFYLNFSVPANVVPLHHVLPVKSNFCFGDVEVVTPSVKGGLGFLLWVVEGFLKILEGYTYDDSWPVRLESFEVGYVGGERDWKYLVQQWS